MKATVNKNLCIGCGLCEATCPSVFELSEESCAKAVEEEVPPELEACCTEAAENCPVDAIEIAE